MRFFYKQLLAFLSATIAYVLTRTKKQDYLRKLIPIYNSKKILIIGSGPSANEKNLKQLLAIANPDIFIFINASINLYKFLPENQLCKVFLYSHDPAWCENVSKGCDFAGQRIYAFNRYDTLEVLRVLLDAIRSDCIVLSQRINLNIIKNLLTGRSLIEPSIYRYSEGNHLKCINRNQATNNMVSTTSLKSNSAINLLYWLSASKANQIVMLGCDFDDNGYNNYISRFVDTKYLTIRKSVNLSNHGGNPNVIYNSIKLSWRGEKNLSRFPQDYFK